MIFIIAGSTGQAYLWLREHGVREREDTPNIHGFKVVREPAVLRGAPAGSKFVLYGTWDVRKDINELMAMTVHLGMTELYQDLVAVTTKKQAEACTRAAFIREYLGQPWSDPFAK